MFGQSRRGCARSDTPGVTEMHPSVAESLQSVLDGSPSDAYVRVKRFNADPDSPRKQRRQYKEVFMFSRKTTVRAAAILGGAALMGLTLVGCSTSGSSGGAQHDPAHGRRQRPGRHEVRQHASPTEFHKANPSITVKVDTRPGGTDGDNLIKTKLSTGTMDDVFLYNSGSLFQALHPDSQLAAADRRAVGEGHHPRLQGGGQHRRRAPTAPRGARPSTAASCTTRRSTRSSA